MKNLNYALLTSTSYNHMEKMLCDSLNKRDKNLFIIKSKNITIITKG